MSQNPCFVIWEQVKHGEKNRHLKLVSVLDCACADVGLPAVPEQLMGVKEVRSMVQLTLCILAEPYSKWLCTKQDRTLNETPNGRHVPCDCSAAEPNLWSTCVEKCRGHCNALFKSLLFIRWFTAVWLECETTPHMLITTKWIQLCADISCRDCGSSLWLCPLYDSQGCLWVWSLTGMQST